jgi:hypothetical protein
MMRPGPLRGRSIRLGANRGNHRRARVPSQSHRALSYRSRTTLHEDGSSFHWTGHVHGSVRSDARNSQTGSLLERNPVR